MDMAEKKSRRAARRSMRLVPWVFATMIGISIIEWYQIRFFTTFDLEHQQQEVTVETMPKSKIEVADDTFAVGESRQLARPSTTLTFSRNYNQRLSKEEFQRIQDSSTWDYPNVDVVYTWVNGSDTSWQREKSKHHELFLEELLGYAPGESDALDDKKLSNGDNRFRDHEELKYSLRSVARFAPWINQVFVVVADGQAPDWLNVSHPKVHLVPHSQIFRDSSHLPTFNSCSIEANLINIPGLSEYFVYFNDDVFLGQPVRPSDFFWSSTRGTHRVFVEAFDFLRIGCTPRCPKSKLGNKICNAGCNVPACGWDMGDCGQEVIEAGMKQIELERQKPQRFTSSNGDFLTTLKFVDGLYNRAFGKSEGRVERRQQQHLPILFSKQMLGDLLARFPYEFNQTSSHRFRHPQDMVFAFSYFYYLEAVRVYAPSHRQIWYAALDTLQKNKSFLYGVPRLPLEHNEAQRRRRIEALDSFSILQNCAHQFLAKTLPDNKISVCIAAVDHLYEEKLRLPANDFVIEHSREHRFTMIDDNLLKTKSKLSEMARSFRKFNAVNDDTTKSSKKISVWYRDMYEALLPDSSPYEKRYYQVLEKKLTKLQEKALSSS